MYIDGWAFKPNEKELQEKNTKRFNEIKDTKGVEYTKESKYGHNDFKGKLTTPEALALSEFDLALIADWGNLCFGGKCTKIGNSFYGSYNTD